MAERFWWFEGATVVALKEQLIAAGDGARLEVHQEPEDKLTLHVIRPGELAAATPLNVSFPCPPVCP
jgi:hypothetical protein